MKIFRANTAILALALFAASCEVETPQRYFEVNGRKAKVNVAFMDTWGTSSDLKSRWYAISFRSEEIEPENYITFFISSFTNETDILAEGTYEYDYLGGTGFFSDLSLGYGIRYDYLGIPTGTRFDEDVAAFSGTITVERDRNNRYRFVFDIEADYDNSLYAITGEYNGTLVLNKNVVDLGTY
ncbi:MAG: hypothetical protein JXB34_10935 [Bacteroidales bacterium]|nr:hypothetical protein [Bacteroidales bacterium]